MPQNESFFEKLLFPDYYKNHLKVSKIFCKLFFYFFIKSWKQRVYLIYCCCSSLLSPVSQASWWLQDSRLWLPCPKPSAAWPLCSPTPGQQGDEGLGISDGDALRPWPLQSGGWSAQRGIWWLRNGSPAHASWRLWNHATSGGRPWRHGQAET